jgi:hypothetical protein
MSSSDCIQLAGVVVAGGALFWTAIGVRQSWKFARSQFYLGLRDDFAKYEEVHIKLRPGGDWTASGTGPSTPDDWVKVEGYMGLFEHCETMMRERLLDPKVFAESHKYRVVNLLHNQRIVEAKLVEAAQGWTRFIDLVNRLELTIPQPAAA